MNEPYLLTPGAHWETSGLNNLLASLGIKDPHTGRPYTEAMLLGVGGGLGGGYMMFEMGGRKTAALGFINSWQKYKGEFSETACGRLGIPVEIKETGSVKVAEAHLRAAVYEGLPVLVTADEASLAHRLLPPELVKHRVHGVVVYGLDGDTALVDDRYRVPVRVPMAELAASRSAITLNKNRMLVFSPPPEEPDLRAAVRAGIRQCCEEMLNPPIKNFGITAWEKWAGLVANPKDKKGWPQVFAKPVDLFDGLRTSFEFLESEGKGRGGLRDLYADFLEEAADLLEEGSLREVATLYREAARQWQGLAEDLLPDSVGPLAETKRSLRKAYELSTDRGAGSVDEVRELLAKVAAARQEAADPAGPLAPAAPEVLGSLHERLVTISRAERAAIDALAASA